MMTALSLNLLQTGKPKDAGGIPLDGLPALEAGRTVPQGFAEALGKASGPHAGDKAGPEGAMDETGEPVPVLEPEAAGGKILPPVRPGLAAGKGMAGEIDPVMEDPGSVPGLGGKDAKPEGVPVMEDAGDRVQELTLAAEGAVPGQGTGTPVIAQQLLAPAGAAAFGTTAGARTAVDGDTADAPAGQTGTLRAAALAPGGVLAAGPRGETGGEGAAPNTGQGAAGGSAARRAEPEAELAAQAATRKGAEPAVAKTGGEAEQAGRNGIALQVRAADRPVVVSEAATQQFSPFAATSSATGAGAIAAPALGTAAPLGIAPAGGPMPHFPELAALVDRIAAARDSAGSASATIALAHKELGNLSLTFETSGRTLDVEVAAQDSDTQRSLAAALAADRPQLRTAETQTGSQNQNQGQQGSSGAAAQNGDGQARQSGSAGEGRGDRGSDGSGRKGASGGTGEPGAAPSSPKSDGAIYA